MTYILLGMALFAVIHSLMAGQRVKQAFKMRFGERAYYGLYRLLYNGVAVVSLAPIGLALVIEPGEVIWRVGGIVALTMVSLQVVGAVGVLVSLAQIDFGQFAGLSQVRAFLTGDPLPLPIEPLQTSGLYGLVRHPLYLFSLLAIWPMPIMTTTLLAFNIAATLYFVIGSLLEEQRMEAAFGQKYVEYKRRVPWLIPGFHSRNS